MAHQSRIRDNAGDAIKAARNWLAGNVSPEQRDITDRELWILFNCDKQAIEKLQAGEFDGVSAGTLLAILNHLKIRFVSEQDLTVLTSEILQKTND
jgi:DNA-binding Xre family transcriptional regulator